MSLLLVRMASTPFISGTCSPTKSTTSLVNQIIALGVYRTSRGIGTLGTLGTLDFKYFVEVLPSLRHFVATAIDRTGYL